MPSPICTVNGSSTTNGFDSTPGATVTIALASSADVRSWSLTCFSTDDLQSPTAITAAISVNQTAKTATLTLPSTARGSAILLKSIVNSGVDEAGVLQSSYTTTFGIFAIGTAYSRLIATKQTNEGNADFGWIEELNVMLGAVFPYEPSIDLMSAETLTTTGSGVDRFLSGCKYHTYLHTTTADYNVAADDVLIMAQADCDIYLPIPTDGRFLIIISQQHVVNVYPNATIEGTKVNHTTQFSFDGVTSSSRTFISNGTDWFVPAPVVLAV